MIPQEDSLNAISDNLLQNQFLIKVLALVLITVLLVVHDTSHDCNCKYVEGPQKEACPRLCDSASWLPLAGRGGGGEFTQPRPSLLRGPFTVIRMTNNAKCLWLFFFAIYNVRLIWDDRASTPVIRHLNVLALSCQSQLDLRDTVRSASHLVWKMSHNVLMGPDRVNTTIEFPKILHHSANWPW